MAGKDDDIERLLAEMQDLTAQADSVLGGDDSSGKSVAKRPAAEPVPTKQEPQSSSMSPAMLRALLVSGAATGLVWVAYVLVPLIGLPLTSLVPVFLASLLVATFYTWRGRRGK